MRHFLVLLSMLGFLAGCSSAYVNMPIIENMADKPQIEPGYGVIFFTVTQDSDLEMLDALIFQNEEKSFTGRVLLKTPENEYDVFDGQLYVLELPIGDYQITEMKLSHLWDWEDDFELGLPLEVTDQRVNYAGNIEIRTQWYNSEEFMAYTKVNNHVEEDLKRLIEAYPKLLEELKSTYLDHLNHKA